MKCVANSEGTIRRVTEHEAKALVAQGWRYVSKGEWKRSVRPDLTKAKTKAQALVKEMTSKLRRV